MPTIADVPPWLLRVFVALFGLAWGSFLNVVIHRMPRGESVIRPASRCPACAAPIRGWNNVPILSWLILKGKARCCGAPISARYVMVEAIGGVLALAVLEAVVFKLPANAQLWRAGLVFLTDFALVMGLVAAAFIDLEHMYIPDSISIGAAVLGAATFWLRPPLSWVDAGAAGAGSFVIVWLLFGSAYRLLRGRTGMGLGDAKLLMVSGAWFGWRGALFALMAGAVQGTLAATVVLLLHGHIEEPEAVRKEREEILASVAAIEDPEQRAGAEQEMMKDPIFEASESTAQSRIAFGPFLALATIEYLLIGRPLLETYAPWLVP